MGTQCIQWESRGPGRSFSRLPRRTIPRCRSHFPLTLPFFLSCARMSSFAHPCPANIYFTRRLCLHVIFFRFCYCSTFVCLWQILFNHRLTKVKRFVSQFSIISFYFCLYLVLNVCAVKFDMTENFENLLDLSGDKQGRSRWSPA